MSTYKSKSGALSLRCDRCGGTFHPRGRALNEVSLRVLAARQGWRVAVSEDPAAEDYCSRKCERAERHDHASVLNRCLVDGVCCYEGLR